jgi:hypothetical protein
MRQAIEVRELIVIGKETGTAIVAALHDVLGIPGRSRRRPRGIGGRWR